MAIFLLEGERLRLRASIGFEREVAERFTVRLGEGVAGTVAARRRPVLLRDACHDPLVRSGGLQERGTQGLYAVPLLNRGDLVGVAHIGTRESDEIPMPQRNLFDALAQRATTAIVKQRLRDEVKRAGEFRERFIGIVSHDLRNPLASIAMAASILGKSPQLPPALQKHAARILGNADRMSKMISDLLDFTRGRLGGGIPIALASADLVQVATRVLAEFEHSHPGRTITLRHKGDARGIWDEARLAQVVSNLVSNALEHGDPQAPVVVEVTGNERSVALAVRNAGPPIPAEALPHVFDPFRRGREGDATTGLGLGLYIASEVARGHGGSIDVASGPGETTFTLRLPRRAARAHELVHGPS